MSIIKKCDVKAYLLTRKQRGKHPFRSVSLPDATRFSNIEPGAPVPNTDRQTETTHKQPSSGGLDIPAVILAPRSARA
jgi:hypothetical protein